MRSTQLLEWLTSPAKRFSQPWTVQQVAEPLRKWGSSHKPASNWAKTKCSCLLREPSSWPGSPSPSPQACSASGTPHAHQLSQSTDHTSRKQGFCVWGFVVACCFPPVKGLLLLRGVTPRSARETAGCYNQAWEDRVGMVVESFLFQLWWPSISLHGTTLHISKKYNVPNFTVSCEDFARCIWIRK